MYQGEIRLYSLTDTLVKKSINALLLLGLACPNFSSCMLDVICCGPYSCDGTDLYE